jgi:hypothetical protein
MSYVFSSTKLENKRPGSEGEVEGEGRGPKQRTHMNKSKTNKQKDSFFPPSVEWKMVKGILNLCHSKSCLLEYNSQAKGLKSVASLFHAHEEVASDVQSPFTKYQGSCAW